MLEIKSRNLLVEKTEAVPQVVVDRLNSQVRSALSSQSIWDLHTHLYPPSFGTPNGAAKTDPDGLLLWGIDELLTYHYLVAEVFRVVPARVLPYGEFWQMTKQEQADHIWRHLFLERSPVSEACRGVLTTLSRLGLDPNERSLDGHRRWFAEQDPSAHIDRIMGLSGIDRVTMTNAVFDDNERARWLADPQVGSDPRFAAVLRFDPLLVDWPHAAQRLSEWGYKTTPEVDAASKDAVRQFLRDWIARTKSIYCAVSLPPEFRYLGADDQNPGNVILRDAVLPELAAHDLPLAMMIGSYRQVNPELRDGGDAVGLSNVASVARLCRDFPDNRFLCTMLARENQHELAVAARKFGNLLVFGCWWFLNNPSLVEEITRLRMELLGTSFVPQHSDARVFEQLIYKWDHSREIIARVLIDKYVDLTATGWQVSPADITRDVKDLMRGNFESFLGARKDEPR